MVVFEYADELEIGETYKFYFIPKGMMWGKVIVIDIPKEYIIFRDRKNVQRVVSFRQIRYVKD